MKQLNHHLTHVLALKEAEESAYRFLDSLHDRLFMLQLACSEIAPHFLLETRLDDPTNPEP